MENGGICNPTCPQLRVLERCSESSDSIPACCRESSQASHCPAGRGVYRLSSHTSRQCSNDLNCTPAPRPVAERGSLFRYCGGRW